MNGFPTSLGSLLRLLVAPSLLAGAACGEPAGPASDLAGTWDYVDSVHAEVGVVPGGRPFEWYRDMLTRSGSRPLDGSRPWLVTTYDPFLQPFLVTTLEEGVRGLVVGGPDIVPWSAVRRQDIAYSLGSDASPCAAAMPPRGDATACEIHIAWTRVGP